MTFNPVNDDDGYFNDLSRQPQLESQDSTSSNGQNGQNGIDGAGDDATTAKPKRIACTICRKRKLRCDGNKPKCATCARLGHNCAYDEVRRKSGPKRGYVKDLEARLAQVEGKLKSQNNKRTQNANEPEQPGGPESAFATREPIAMQPGIQQSMPNVSFDAMPTNDPIILPMTNIAPDMMPEPDFLPQVDLNLDQSFSWEMIGLGLEEPMPTPEAVDELTQVFFDTIHPALPMIHKYRFYTSMDLAPDRRPPICLRYSMWCHAASVTEKYMHHQEIFYRRARKYIELDEMKSQGEAFVSLAHAQTWVLICAYEFKMMYFPRAWMSVGRASRLALMMGLNRVDGAGVEIKQALPPARDATELEERRRTFWMAYCVDRYASVGTGWPMAVDERDIMTCLPVSEEAYERGLVQKAPTLEEAMTPQQAAQLSSFGGVVLVTHFFGLNLTHLHRPEHSQEEHDMNGPFWKRHRTMDNDLLKIALQLPSYLRLPSGVRNPNIVFLNFALHTSTICLHQAAIFKAEKYNLPATIIEQSRTRCILAAAEIATVMRLSSHVDLGGMNPFMAFCLYVAARVFVQYIKKMPDDQEVRQSLEFLLAAMQAIQRKNPLTESFLIQLRVDIEGSGIETSLCGSDPQLGEGTGSTRAPADYGVSKDQCSTIFHVSETSEDGRSPTDHLSPENTRFSRHEARKESPTVSTEGPYQQTFAYRGAAEAFARNSSNTQPYFTESTQSSPHLPQDDIQKDLGAQTRQFENMYASDDSKQSRKFKMAGLNPFTDSDKISAFNNASNRHLDTEMADQSANSRGLTPQSSGGYNHSSSNTSYSPRQAHDDDPNVNGATGGGGFMIGFAPPTRNVSAQQQADPFKVPVGWETGTGLTPGQGMTPDGGWEKLMDSMSWESGRTG